MSELLQKTAALALFRLAAHLPGAAKSLLAHTVAWLAWHLRTGMRRVTEVNLALCYPQLDSAARQKLAKKSLYHTVMTALEIPTVWTQAAEKSLKQIIEVHSKQLLDDAQAQGKGVIVIASYLGNWEYLGLFLGKHYPTTSLYKPPRKAWLEDITRQGREKTGATLMPTNKKGVLAVLKALKAGGVTGILPDQVPEGGNGAAFAPFFGQPAATMTLIPSLLQRGNVIAVAGFAQRLANGRFRIIFQPAPVGLYSEDEQTSAAALNQAVEQLVELAPEQYQWEYKRFRIGADGKKQRIY